MTLLQGQRLIRRFVGALITAVWDTQKLEDGGDIRDAGPFRVPHAAPHRKSVSLYSLFGQIVIQGMGSAAESFCCSKILCGPLPTFLGNPPQNGYLLRQLTPLCPD